MLGFRGLLALGFFLGDGYAGDEVDEPVSVFIRRDRRDLRFGI